MNRMMKVGVLLVLSPLAVLLLYSMAGLWVASINAIPQLGYFPLAIAISISVMIIGAITFLIGARNHLRDLRNPRT